MHFSVSLCLRASVLKPVRPPCPLSTILQLYTVEFITRRGYARTAPHGMFRLDGAPFSLAPASKFLSPYNKGLPRGRRLGRRVRRRETNGSPSEQEQLCVPENKHFILSGGALPKSPFGAPFSGQMGIHLDVFGKVNAQSATVNAASRLKPTNQRPLHGGHLPGQRLSRTSWRYQMPRLPSL